MPARTLILSALVLAAALPAAAQRRGRATPVPKLSEETLIPTEVFAPADARRFGYPNGFDVVYTRSDQGHTWKLTEKSLELSLTPTPAAAPGGVEGEAASSPTPTPEPTATPAGPPIKPLPPSPEEAQFLAEVGMVRPTFVTLVFTDSAQAAAERVDALLAEKSDEAVRPANLAVMGLEADPKLAPKAVVYNREFNLGPKSGGMRRGSTVVIAKGPVFLRVDAYWGLKDGAYEAELETLEKRARDVAGYLLRKM